MTDTTQTVVLTAPDISCGHCVATVNSALSALDGIAGVDASADTKLVTVTFDPRRASEPQIREALDEAGYPAAS